MPIGTYTPPPPCKIITQIFFPIFLILFFHCICILLQISHKKCFFISISIPERSGVKHFGYCFSGLPSLSIQEVKHKTAK